MASTPSVALVVRFADGHPDLTLTLPATTTIAQVKTTIQRHRPEWSTLYLKLIHQGRLLGDSLTLPRTLPELIRSVLEGTALPTCYLLCAASEGGGEGVGAVPVPRRPVTGFDRLLDIGFSREEVESLRTQFRVIRGMDPNEQSEAARNAEEAWIDNGARDPQTVVEPTSPERYRDLVLGLCMGFFGGILAVVWMGEPKVFTSRQQMGILAGLLINLSFGLLRIVFTFWVVLAYKQKVVL